MSRACVLMGVFLGLLSGCSGELELDGDRPDTGMMAPVLMDMEQVVPVQDMQVIEDMEIAVEPDASDMSSPPDLSLPTDMGPPPPEDMETPPVDMGPPPPEDMGPPPPVDMGPPVNQDGFYLDQVNWLDPNISGWNESATLSSVTFERGRDICLNYSIPGGGTWPVVQIFGSTDVVANAWVFIERNGTWYGATWEWMRPGQTCKAMTSVAGDHIKKNPFGENSGWTPQSGQVLYFMVSGLIRNNIYSNVSERTNVVRAVWP